MIDNMLLIILQLLSVLFIFFGIRIAAHYLIEEADGYPPKWLDYQPFNCEKCLTSWMLVGSYTAFWLLTSCTLTLVVGLALTALNAIAMHVDEKSKTISLKDYIDDDFTK